MIDTFFHTAKWFLLFLYNTKTQLNEKRFSFKQFSLPNVHNFYLLTVKCKNCSMSNNSV